MDSINSSTKKNLTISESQISNFVKQLQEKKPQAYDALAGAVKAASSSSNCNWVINNAGFKGKMIELGVIDSSGKLATSIYNVVFGRLQSTEDVGGGGGAAAATAVITQEPTKAAKQTKAAQIKRICSTDVYSKKILNEISDEELLAVVNQLASLKSEATAFQVVLRAASNYNPSGKAPSLRRMFLNQCNKAGVNPNDIRWEIIKALVTYDPGDEKAKKNPITKY